MRTRTGNGVIYRQGTLRRALRLLQDGKSVGILIDQHIQSKDAIHVDFFNRPAATTPIVAALLQAGYKGWYDFEVFSDDGRWGNDFPDSLWKLPHEEFVTRGARAFVRTPRLQVQLRERR